MSITMIEDRLLKLINSLIRGNRLNRHIPVIGFDFHYPLKFMRQPNEPWFSPETSAAQKSQALVIKATTHAEAVAIAIEGHEGHEDEIEFLRTRTVLRAYRGLEYAQAVVNQRCVRIVRCEPKSIMTQARQDRQITGFAGLP